MENTALILLVTTNVLLVLVLGAFGFFIYRLLKDQKQNRLDDRAEAKTQKLEAEARLPIDAHPAILERVKGIEQVKHKRMELFCPNHPDEPGEASCAICDGLYCRACIKPFKAMHLCKEHLPMIMKNSWEEVITIKTSTEDPEQGVRLYDVKKKLFKEENLPSYIETHYKIDVDHDQVETFLVLFAMKQELSVFKEKLLSFNPYEE